MPVALIDILAGHQLKGRDFACDASPRNRQGRCFIEVSLIQSAIASLANQATNWLVGGKIPQKQGSAHPNIAPYGDVFKTAEGHEILLAMGNDSQFRDLCDLLDLQEIAADEKFKRTNQGLIIEWFCIMFCRKNLNAFIRRTYYNALQQGKIPAGMIQNIKEVFETPQAKISIGKWYHHRSKNLCWYASHQQLTSHFLPPPHYGEHTAEVLQKWLEISREAIQKLISNGSVA